MPINTTYPFYSYNKENRFISKYLLYYLLAFSDITPKFKSGETISKLTHATE